MTRSIFLAPCARTNRQALRPAGCFSCPPGMRLGAGIWLCGALSLFALGHTVNAADKPAMRLRLPAIFADHMAVQAEAELALWGWDAPGTRIEAACAGHSAEAQAAPDGRWRIKLPPLKPGGPYEITVKGSSEIVIRNVVAGEVWLCSGQSNMEFPVSGVKGRDLKPELADPESRTIRIFRVPFCSAGTPQADCPAGSRPSTMRDESLDQAAAAPADCQGRWTECSEKTVRQFSAVGYFFGRKLRRELKTPIGLIDASWGATAAEAWTSLEALRENSALPGLADRYDQAMAGYPAAKAEVAQKLAELEKARAAAPDDQGWESPTHDDSAWKQMNLPQMWRFAGLNFNGRVWFRQSVNLPEAWRGRELALSLAKVSGDHVVYANGAKLGGGGNDPRAVRTYKIPGELSAAAKLVIAVSVYHDTDYGGFRGTAAEMSLACASVAGAPAISLAGAWKYAPAMKTAKLFPYAANFPMGPGNRNLPTGAFNGMIHPLIPFALRGVIWYQGESNAGRAKEYKTLFPALIADWRRQWGGKNIPFLFVQLSETFDAKPESRPTWAELRDAQLETLNIPNTGMAVTIDIGERGQVHPNNKWEVGLRLAGLALDGTYGRPQICNGPLYDSMSLDGARLKIKFRPGSIGSGLAVRNNETLRGFALRGVDGPWLQAQARIEGDAVVVWNETLKKPLAARYAWAQNPFAANLMNREGLPASPFRTDHEDATWPSFAADH